MEKNTQKKPFWKKISFWLIMILFGFPFIIGNLIYMYNEITLTPEQKDSIANAVIARTDSIKAVEDSIKANRPKVFNMPKTREVYQVEHYLKENLNDPDSYESVKWYDVHLDKETNIYSVRHKYRANNAFGGKILCDQIFYLNKNGSVIGAENTK